MSIDPQLVEHYVIASGKFAKKAWKRIDSNSIGQVAICLAIPDAQHKIFGITAGNSTRVPMSLPPTVVAPDPALVVRKEQVDEDETSAFCLLS